MLTNTVAEFMRALAKAADFLRDHRESAAFISDARGFDIGIECQQAGLVCKFFHIQEKAIYGLGALLYAIQFTYHAHR